jgi:hypothetical protein
MNIAPFLLVEIGHPLQFVAFFLAIGPSPFHIPVPAKSNPMVEGFNNW